MEKEALAGKIQDGETTEVLPVKEKFSSSHQQSHPHYYSQTQEHASTDLPHASHDFDDQHTRVSPFPVEDNRVIRLRLDSRLMICC